MLRKYLEVLGDQRLAEFDLISTDTIRGAGKGSVHKRSELYMGKNTGPPRLGRHKFRRPEDVIEPEWIVTYLRDDNGQEYTAI